MSKTLEERLSSHNQAFSGLLSLIPAKYYYDEDTQNQWQKKKQSKAKKKANKRAKFDPEAGNTALDESKRRQEQMDQKEDEDDWQSASESESGDENESESESDQESEQENGNVSLQNDEDDIQVVFDDEGNELQLESNHSSDSKKESAKKENKKKANNTEGVAELRARLASKIKEMREKRKAPGTGAGAPLNREALLESRRHKKEVSKERKKRKREEDGEDDEDSDQSFESESEAEDTKGDDDQLLFSQVRFKDGKRTTSDLSSIREDKKRKKRDTLGELKHLQAKKAKIASLDEQKRKQIEQNAQWSRAILQSEGEKVRDDEKLLKKSLKQKQNKKKKSEREWKERKRTVATNIAARQAKREENLKARREMKGLKGKKKKRAGFEGRKGKSKGKSNKSK